MSKQSHSTNIIGEKERTVLERVLREYNIAARDIARLRSAYKVEGNDDMYFVKRMRHGSRKAGNGCVIVEALNNTGFLSTAKYYPNKEGAFFTKYGKYIYYVTSWIDGTEIDIENFQDALSCIELLARFHLAANCAEIKSLKIKNNLKNWPRIFTGNLSDLERYRYVINKKKIKNQFDNTYMDLIDFYYSRGVTALSILNSSNYHELSKSINNNRTICHDSFYYQNILKGSDGLYLIDFDSIIIDLQIVDLSKFIRRIMFRKNYEWNFDKAKILIEHYSNIKAVTKEELEIMLALLTFPHKFWKLGKKRYIKTKGWNEAKYLRKLNKITKFREEEQIFMENFIDYINSAR